MKKKSKYLAHARKFAYITSVNTNSVGATHLTDDKNEWAKSSSDLHIWQSTCANENFKELMQKLKEE